MKKCKRCGVTKPLDEYSWYNVKGLRPRSKCKVCRAEEQREYRNKNHAKVLDTQRKSHEKHKQKRSAKRIERIYNITEEQHNSLLEEQNHCCAICKTDSPMGRGTWHVDHCHETNEVRGLLCSKCNAGLGFFNDNIESLKNAITYLETTSIRQRLRRTDEPHP